MEKNLQQYLTTGVRNLVRELSKAAFRNPKAAAFMAEYALSNRSANHRRKEFEDRGEHIPPFLIASITTRCNLHCRAATQEPVTDAWIPKKR